MHALSRTGYSLLELVVVIAILAVLAALSISAVVKVRSAAQTTACLNNLRQLGLAMQAYQGSRNAFPAGMQGDGGLAHLTWAAPLTPYLDQEALWRQTLEAYAKNPSFWKPEHDEPRGTIVPVFVCPADDRTKKPSPWGDRLHGQLSYLGVAGVTSPREDGILFRDSAVRASDISDGLSNTLLLGERPPSGDLRFGWWYAGWGQQRDGSGDSVLGVRDRCRRDSYCGQCEEPAYHFVPDRIHNTCAFLHFWSLHAGGGHFLLADGSARMLRYSADRLLPVLATRAGHESELVP